MKDKVSVKDDKILFAINKTNSEFKEYYNFLYQLKGKSYNSLLQIDDLVCKQAHRFTLYTTYPGLVIGTGYDHGTKSIGDSAIGFYFDHTSGLPLIPGSSIKGIIRSAFENMEDKVDQTNIETIKGLLEEITNQELVIDANVLKEIIIETFGTESKEGCDVFFDAVLKVDSLNPGQSILAEDFITPHHENFYKNPTPLQFLKVKSGIPFEFRFKVKDSLKYPFLTDIVKIELYKHILLLLGVGAKTNVGYGRINEIKIEKNTALNTKLEPSNFQGASNNNQNKNHNQKWNKGKQNQFSNKKKW